MTITPQEIQSKQFHVRLRGFDVDEVDKFLEKISEEFLVLSLEHKQAFERIDTLEKEIANFRNKEQGFQNAILSAQRISDEMQERSRRESEEALRKARQEAAELEAKTREVAETTLFRAGMEAESIKELAESKSREMVENLGAKMVSLTTEINRLVTIKEGITSDLRRLLEDYLSHLEEGLPASLRDLQPLPPPEPVLPPKEPAAQSVTFSAEPDTGQQKGLWGAVPPSGRQETTQGTAADQDDSLDNLYEKIDIGEDLLDSAPMTSLGTDRNDEEEFAAMNWNDIETLELDDTAETERLDTSGDRVHRPQADIAIDAMERDMLFTLEDPLDDLEPSISILGDDARNKR
ncbi:MAG TPA: DivIVA domain-containing protein [Desulfurivibrionaceae bacterium]|nr:DivIVA domain-containing protein [Desulfurivibrionaceae bacterium]